MSDGDFLRTFAEVAVAFAGFASLNRVLWRSAEFVDGTPLLGMVRTSLPVTGFALLPLVLPEPCVSERPAWRLSASLLLVFSGVLFLGVSTSFVHT